MRSQDRRPAVGASFGDPGAIGPKIEVRLESEDLWALDRQAAELGLSRAALVRRFVREGLERGISVSRPPVGNADAVSGVVYK